MGIILDEADNLSEQIGCYLTGNSSAYVTIHAFISNPESSVVYIDADTMTAWSAPVSTELAERYYYNIGGPDFLQRLEGDYSYSPGGLTTFIYVPELEEQALSVKPRSRAAYRYFSDEGSCNQVSGMPAWFGMDSSDADKFGIDGLLSMASCESES